MASSLSRSETSGDAAYEVGSVPVSRHTVEGEGVLLRAKIDLVWPGYVDAAARFWAIPPIQERYVEFLIAIHMIIRASVPLMTEAADRAEAMASDDLAVEVAKYFKRHIREEMGHDDWVLEDLKAIGRDPMEAVKRFPPAAVASLVGAQYYWLRYFHPATLLGYCAALEGHPTPLDVAQDLITATGLPKTGFRTVWRHAALDVRHSQELFDLVDALPMDARHSEALGVSALHCVSALIWLVDDMATTAASGAN